MPKISDAQREQRRTQIVEAAQRCMMERGIRGASMQDIIRESGLSAGAIYGHFDGKQAILLEAARRVLVERLGAVTDDQLASARFTDIIAGFVRGHPLATPDKGALLLQWWGEATVDGEVHDIVQQVAAMLGDTYEEQLRAFALRHHGVDEGEAAAWAARMRSAAIGISQGALVQSALLDGFDIEAYLAACEPLFHP